MGDYTKRLKEQLGITDTNKTEEPTTGSYLDSLKKQAGVYNDKTPFVSSQNPQDGLFAPGELEVSNESMINIDQEALNGDLTNSWNSFKRGIDEIQIMEDKGRLAYNALGGAPQRIIDMYPDDIAVLEDNLNSGKISEEQFQTQKLKLDESLKEASDEKSRREANINANIQEIANEPVSKEYLWQSWLTQQKGDSSSLGERLYYTAPGVIGSSAALVVPQLFATFANNITKGLIKSSVTHILGPEVGIPANIIASVGAASLSVAEILYGRSKESYAEIGGAVDEARELLVEKFLKENNLQDPSQISEEDMRQIRLQSYKGLDTMYKENMALAAVDIAQAMLMPLSNFGKLPKALTKTKTFKDTIKGYSKARAGLYFAGKRGTDAILEKQEEGSQFAFNSRYVNSVIDGEEYQDKGFILNTLNDMYDSAASLNYSLIPGLDLRGSGRYSQDKEFQFSENSGAMLSGLMSVIPSAISIAKEFKRYREANADVNGVDFEGKFNRLPVSILAKYFENEEIHHLGQGVKSLSSKKDESGKPIITETQADNIISDMEEKYALYSSINKRVQDIGKDSLLGFKSSKEQKTAKAMVLEDALLSSVNIIEKSKNSKKLKQEFDEVSKQNIKFHSPEAAEYVKLNARLEATDNIISASREAVDEGYITEKVYNKRIDRLNSLKSSLEKSLEEELTKLKEQGINDTFTHSVDMSNSALEMEVNDIFLKEEQDKYNDLLKTSINDSGIKKYYEDNKHRIPVREEAQEDIQEDVQEDVQESQESPVQDAPVEDIEDIEEVPEAPTPSIKDMPTESLQDKRMKMQADMMIDKERKGFTNAIESTEPLVKRSMLLKGHIMSLTGGQMDISIVDNPVLPMIIGVMMELFDADYIQNMFPVIQDLVLALRPGDPVFILNSNMELVEKSALPPEQAGEFSYEENKNIMNRIGKDDSDPYGTGLKIVSGLALAQANIIGDRGEDGRWFDSKGEDGILKFSEQYDQQLVNSDFINPLDEVFYQVNIPEDFDKKDTSDENYDKLEIKVLKYSEGDIRVARHIGYLHRVTKLKDLLALESPEVSLEEEERKLREARIAIVNSDNLTSIVEDKGFGFINMNRPTPLNMKSVNEATVNDPRVKLTVVDESGAPFSVGNETIRAVRNLIPGSNIILVPNENGRGEFIPMYGTKNKLSTDENIHKKVSKSIEKYIVSKSIKDLQEAEKYIFITTIKEDQSKLGKKGVYRMIKPSGEVMIMINNKNYTANTVSEIPAALGEVYFTLNKDYLNDATYQDEIKNSRLLTTNITPNSVLLNKDYSLKEKRSYFSQHTLTLSSPVGEVKETVEEEEIDDTDTDLDIDIDNIDISKDLDDIGLGLDFREDPVFLQDPDFTIEDNPFLVSAEISPGLQDEAILSFAYLLLNTRPVKELDYVSPYNVPTPADIVLVSGKGNKERLKADLSKKERGLATKLKTYKTILSRPELKEKVLAKTPTFEKEVDKVELAHENYKIVLKDFDALTNKAEAILQKLEFNNEDETDYYESQEETDEYASFREDSNATRDQRDFLPKEIKKILYFIPQIDTNDEGEPIIRRNSLLLPTFNNFNDTWEKLLNITSKHVFDSTRSGYLELIDILKNKEVPFTVQEIAKVVEKSSEQTQNAFFRRVLLQDQKNIGLTVREESFRDNEDSSIEHKRSSGRVTSRDNQRGVKQVLEQMEQEFRNSKSGILSRQLQQETGMEILVINTEYANELRERLNAILNDESSFVRSASKGRIKGTITKFDDDAKRQVYLIIKDMGINLNYEAFEDLLKFHRPSKNKLQNEVDVVESIFVKRLLKTLTGETTVGYKDYERNNIFTIEKTSMNIIANFEFKYRAQRQSGAYRFEGKSYYAYTRHNYISEIFTAIDEYRRTGQDKLLKQKLNDDFAKNSKYIKLLLNNDEDFMNAFELNYELGAKNSSSNSDSKRLNNMSEREHEITKLKYFQNQGRRSGYFFFDTLSDKTTKAIVKTLKVSVDLTEGSIDNGIKLSDNTLEELYVYFEAELERVNRVKEQNQSLENKDRIKGYHDIGKNLGMGKFFNIYFFLNKAFLDVDNPELSSTMYDSNGDIKTVSKELIKTEINKHFNKLFKKTKSKYKSLGLYNIYSSKEKGLTADIKDLVDHKYIMNQMSDAIGNKRAETDPRRRISKINNPGVAVRLGYDALPEAYQADIVANYAALGQENLEKIVDYSIVDFVVNYTVFSNEMLMFTGDPAQAGKPLKDSAFKDLKDDSDLEKKKLMAHITSTYVNLGKRNASFVGSGEKGLFDSLHYNVAYANDISIDSPELEQYLSWFPENKSAVKKAYGEGDLTDAQELTTVKEHLHVMLAYGQINRNTYNKALYTFDRDQYDEDFKKGLVPDIKVTPEESSSLKVIMQPQKPVQRSNMVKNDLRISKQYYIKTSSYPLIPSMLQGTMKDLLNDMKAKDISRVAFASGVKQGLSGSKDIIKNDAYNSEFLTDNKQTLSRNGFRIQLEVPYKEYKKEIREGTQMAKMLFVDIPDDVLLIINGKEKTAKELKENYIEYHKDIIKIQKEMLLEELTDDGKNISLKKLSKFLIREGEGRNYPLDSLLGLTVTDNNFTVPLAFSPNVGEIEPVLSSIISNRLTRLKMPGKSYVQGSEIMLRADTEADLRSILWTKSEYKNIQKLKYLREEDGSVKYAQIIMPFYFIDGKKKVPVSEYTIEEDGRKFIDLNKIDPELLEINGFRIPFQGHNSGMWFEIVGFLPDTSGDLIIVPGEIAAEMGSDYDVDKLFAYMYNYTVEDNKLNKIKSDNPSSLEELQNALIDIHKAIFTSSDENIRRAILDPLSFSDIEYAIEESGTEEAEFLGTFDPLYQSEVYFSNITGKDGTAISANANTSHALAQQSNLFVKGLGVLFKDENGLYYRDSVDDNRVNELTDDMYSWMTEEGTTESQKNKPYAWRLDKINTFTRNPETDKPYRISNLISQLLGVSVDNAKEQKLGAFGINKHNFGVSFVVLRSGFDFRFLKAFINQPILKELYGLLEDTEDIYRIDYSRGKREKVIDSLFEKYNKNIVDDIQSEESFEGYSLKELQEGLSKPINTNARQQLNILKAFLRYQDIGKELQKITSVFNIDVKGLPQNMTEVIDKRENIQELSSSNIIGNISKYKRKTIPGKFIDIPAFTASLFMNSKNPIFPYASITYREVISKVANDTGRLTLSREQKNKITSGIKQFIYSNYNTENIDALKDRLLFGDSLQDRLLELRKKYEDNELLASIKIETSINVADPKLIFMQPAGDAQRIKDFWTAMLSSKDAALSDFAKDLAKYALYISPEEFGRTSLIRYIPLKHLKEIGFLDYLRAINKDVYKEDNDVMEGFAEMFVQHNADFLISAFEKNIIKNSGVYERKSVIMPDGSAREIRIVLNAFSLPTITEDRTSNPAANLIRTDDQGVSFYPKYLAYYVDPTYGKQIFEQRLNGDGTYTYYRIDRLGSDLVSEYTRTGSNSIFFTNRTTISIPPGSAAVIATTKQEEIPNVPFIQQSNIKDMLAGIIYENTLEDPNINVTQKTYKDYYSYLASVYLDSDVNVKITLDNNLPARGATRTDGTEIIINPSRMKGRTSLGTNLELQRTLLHEITHALAIKSDKSDWTEVRKVWEEYKSNIRKEGKTLRGVNTAELEAETYTEIKKRYDDTRGKVSFGEFFINAISDEATLRDILSSIQVDAKNPRLTEDQDRFLDLQKHIIDKFGTLEDLDKNSNIYYSYASFDEFITESLTNPETQKKLMSMGSIFKELISKIKDKIRSILNIPTEERTLFDDAIDHIFDELGLPKEVSKESKKGVSLNMNTYKYYGADYTIILNDKGEGIDVKDYKGKYANLKKLLNHYNENPNVDPQNGKYFRETPEDNPKPVKEDMLNEGQKQAFIKAKAFLDTPSSPDVTENMFLLSGKGGTGKTFTTEVIIDEIKSRDKYGSVEHVAPTWNAVNEVIKASSKDDYKASTFASFVGTELSEPNNQGAQSFILFDDAKIAYLRKIGALPKVFTAKYIFIDEASMIGGDGKLPKVTGQKVVKGQKVPIIESSDAYQTLLYRLEQREDMGFQPPEKIFFIGDYAQIPPVGTTADHDASIIEELMKHEDTHHILTENMRTGKDDLNKLHELYRNNIDIAREQIKKGIPSNESIIRNPLDTKRTSTENILYTNSQERAIDEFVKYYKMEPENVTNAVFINYNKYTRPETQNLISKIRKELFGTDKELYHRGELLLLNGNMEATYEYNNRLESIKFHNETRFIVKDIEKDIEKTISADSISIKMLGDNLTLVTQIGKKTVEFEKFVPKPGSDKIFGKYNSEIKGYIYDEQKIPYGTYLKFKEEMPTLNYGYVVNSHKVQGSTYNYVVVDEQNILASPATNKEVNNMMYTATSRPKYKLVMYNPYSNNSEYKIKSISVVQEEHVVLKPYPGVVNIPNSGMSIKEANQFIDIMQPFIRNQAYVENKAKTANRMFAFGLRWAKNIPNITEKSKQNNGNPRPNKISINSYNDYTYGYYSTDQNNNPIPSIDRLNPIMKFIESKLNIDLSNYDAMLGNIYENNSFIHQHRDITESKTASKYPVVVLNIGSDGSLIFDKNTSNKNINSSEAYSKFQQAIDNKDVNIDKLKLTNGGIYAFGVDGINRFTFNHRINDGIGSTPTQPLIVPEFDNEGNKIGEKTLNNYRITLTFRRAGDLNNNEKENPINSEYKETLEDPLIERKAKLGFKKGDC